MKRPTGVTVVAVLLVIVGATNIISGLAAGDELSTFWMGLQVVIGILAIACGVGCWQLKKWARMATIIMMGLNAISLIGMWIYYSNQANVSVNVPRVLFPLAINVAVILYLVRSEVKEVFGN
jgi:uncharacterized membrane protein